MCQLQIQQFNIIIITIRTAFVRFFAKGVWAYLHMSFILYLRLCRILWAFMYSMDEIMKGKGSVKLFTAENFLYRTTYIKNKTKN